MTMKRIQLKLKLYNIYKNELQTSVDVFLFSVH
jgi:hypothetical protein